MNDSFKVFVVLKLSYIPFSFNSFSSEYDWSNFLFLLVKSKKNKGEGEATKIDITGTYRFYQITILINKFCLVFVCKCVIKCGINNEKWENDSNLQWNTFDVFYKYFTISISLTSYTW